MNSLNQANELVKALVETLDCLGELLVGEIILLAQTELLLKLFDHS